MKQSTDGVNLTESNISMKEFDMLTEAHEFSEKYKKNKRVMLRKYRRSLFCPNRTGILKAAAVLFLFLTVPALAAAASGSGFFSRIWGTSGRKNIESHTEEVYDEQEGSSYTVTYPQRDYTDDYLEKAKDLIGDAVSYTPIVKEAGDIRLTVLAAVCDGNAAVLELTLEKEGGVDFLNYSQLDNESKGAWFSEDSPFYFQIAEGYENLFVDLEKSTEDKLYCYDYIVMGIAEDDIKGITMETGSFQDREADRKTEATDSLFIPIGKKVERKTYQNQEGGIVSLSPISMKVDVSALPGLTSEEACDPWHIYYVAVNYKDGAGYTVHEHEVEGVHECGAEIDKTSYISGSADGQLVLVFNRLADTENVESVVVNETVYTAK